MKRYLTSNSFSLLGASCWSPLVLLLVACANVSQVDNPSTDPEQGRQAGQSIFESAPPPSGGFLRSTAESGTYDAANAAPASADGKATASTSTSVARDVEETDLYRLEGNKLYFLNSYRGLMIFDLTDLSHPKLIGRSPIYGTPIQMIVREGIATVVVSDWYGKMDDGTPFHGSIVRGLDARDPTDIKVLGEAKLGGYVQDTRVVGDVLYAVSQNYGWYYGWEDSTSAGSDAVTGVSTVSSTNQNAVIVSSVSFASGKMVQKSRKEYPGWSGIFHVSEKAILLGHGNGTENNSEVVYLDISDPGGNIVERGRKNIEGNIQGWGQDNGRWNIDFAHGRYARVLTQRYAYNGGYSYGDVLLSTVDFDHPDSPSIRSTLSLQRGSYSQAARFDGDRLYVASTDYSAGEINTPISIIDLQAADAPKLTGTLNLQGQIWGFFPAGDHLFALGNAYKGYWSSSKVALSYFDVSSAQPKSVGTATFGEGWAWTPAASTFKAFSRKVDVQNLSSGIVALPFSGWSQKDYRYSNGVQLLSYSANKIQARGASTTKGWVERGIFVEDKVVSLSDQSLSVMDYTDIDHPKTLAELTLARNVVDAKPEGSNLTLLSSDWWGNDTSSSELRVLPKSEVDEERSGQELANLSLEGVNARIYRNGNMGYVVTTISVDVPCQTGYGYGGYGGYRGYGGGYAVDGVPSPSSGGSSDSSSDTSSTVDAGAANGGGAAGPSDTDSADNKSPQVDADLVDSKTSIDSSSPVDDADKKDPTDSGDSGSSQICKVQTQLVRVVDFSGRVPLLRGRIELPAEGQLSSYGWGCYWYDWYNGRESMLIDGRALAFRRMRYVYDADTSTWKNEQKLYVVDVSRADTPTIASVTQTPNEGWWGNMVVSGKNLYSTHYEWLRKSVPETTSDSGYNSQQEIWTVKYFLDRYDLSDLSHPRVASSINVPGIFVGASQDDPSVLYFTGYRWDSSIYAGDGQVQTINDFSSVRISGDKAELLSNLALPGYMGQVFIRGNKAYSTLERYSWLSSKTYEGPRTKLIEIDLTKPESLSVRSSNERKGFGWLVGVEGDRAFVTTGWNSGYGIDIYKLTDGNSPQFDGFVRTRGYASENLVRDGSDLYMSSGYWGVEHIQLSP